MLDECFGKIKQVIIIADDIMIVGYKSDHSDHDQAFTTLLQTSKKCNVKLNYDKLHYKQNEAEFSGETYTKSGCKPSKDKVAAITSMPSLTNKKRVQSFIGMINYLAKFSQRLCELVEPIREFSKDKGPLYCRPQHQQASAPVLTYYNPKKQTTLQTDASIKGLGPCLLQDSKPVYFASKAPTNAQKGYVVIELESCSGLGNGGISSFSLWQSFSTWNWPETTWNHII